MSGLDERRIRPRGVAVVMLLVGLLVAGVVMFQSRPLPNSVAYSVEGERTSAEALKKEAITLEALYGVQVPTDPDEQDAFWRDLAQSAVMSDLLAQAAADEGIVIADREVDEALMRYVTALYDGAPDAQAQFVRALGNAGTSQRAVETEIARRLMTERLIADVVATVTVPTPEAAAAAFTERRCSLELPETRTVRNIVVATEPEAANLVTELAAGADFATLASRYSMDPSSRDSGGQIGTLAARQLESAYAEAAFTAEPGQVFGPISTESGWNVGEVTAIDAPRTVDYAEVEASFIDLLLMEQQSAAWRDWLEDLLAETDVEYSDAYRPDDPMKLPDGVADWVAQSGICPAGATEES